MLKLRLDPVVYCQVEGWECVEVREFDGSGKEIWPQGFRKPVYLYLVVDSVCSIFLIFSNVEFGNKDHLRTKKRLHSCINWGYLGRNQLSVKCSWKKRLNMLRFLKK